MHAQVSVGRDGPALGRQLYLVGSSGADTVTATYGAGGRQLRARRRGSFDAEPTDAGGCTRRPARPRATCPLAGAARLDPARRHGRRRHDQRQRLPRRVSVVELGGEGDDTLTGGASEDVLVDGPGPAPTPSARSAATTRCSTTAAPTSSHGGAGNDLFLSVSICDGETIRRRRRRRRSRQRLLGAARRRRRRRPPRPGPGRRGRRRRRTASCPGGSFDSLNGIEDLEGSEQRRRPGRQRPRTTSCSATAAPTPTSRGAGDDTILANSGDRDRRSTAAKGSTRR